MDLNIYNRRPTRRGPCPACKQHADVGMLDADTVHTCRSAPATPRATRDAQLAAADRVLADRELEIRRQRLAEITRGW
jgi:hypothetical protein